MTQRCKGHQVVWPCSVNDPVESDSAVSMTLLSLTLQCQWPCWVWLSGVNDTANMYLCYIETIFYNTAAYEQWIQMGYCRWTWQKYKGQEYHDTVQCPYHASSCLCKTNLLLKGTVSRERKVRLLVFYFCDPPSKTFKNLVHKSCVSPVYWLAGTYKHAILECVTERTCKNNLR